ncbi:GDP-mannose:cellobiosyl-diphosphopolyprenol alpha-mannosyltransferase [Geobacillus thermodenitrificans]|uniref:glycosyltransferase n=1 Tax=Geobacillus thermodenitrificans TaxID=33940 RepID=UPI000A295380|nr:glycosyltransferase [Geobacillus thermodenitrificans]ARP44337.1 GDP-mannose:cellobiosyl-diphosphopolyprenol alpha-mannosyltransferase [Geobacillus thermodenitrificans]
MRIAHIGKFKKNSANGVNQCIYYMAINQVKLGHKVYVYTFDNETDRIRKKNVDGVNVVFFPKHRMKGFLLPKEFINYVKRNEDGIDVYHLHSVFLPENIMISKFIKQPFIITPHGGYSPRSIKRSFISYAKKIIFKSLFEKSFLNKAHKIHALTPNEAKDLIAFGVDDKKIFIAPNGVQLPNIDSITKIKNQKKRFLFIGRLDMVHKGLDLLLKGFANFIRENNIDSNSVELIIAGPDNHNHLRILKRLSGSLKIDKYVTFMGKVYGIEKEKLIQSADFFVHTSRWEGMPISLLEALSYGKPLLISEQTNIGEYVKSYEAGVVVELDEISIAKGFNSILVLNNEKDLSRNALLLAKEQFSWLQNTQIITENYNISI